jgi:hypothetical protein
MNLFTRKRLRALPGRSEEGDRFLVLALIAGILANWAPLFASEYLPFTDLSGHMGLAGALAHWDDAAARIQAYFDRDIRLIPGVLFEAFAFALHPVLGVPAATNLFIGLFCVAGVPLALLYVLRAFRCDPRLSLLALPFLYHRCIWYGFVNYAASVPLLLVSIGLLEQCLEDGRLGVLKRRRFVALALMAFMTVAAHAFGAMVLFGLALLLILVSMPRLRTLGAILASLAPALAYLFRWLRTGTHTGSPSGLLAQITGARRPIEGSLDLFYQWTINGLASDVDQYVFIAGAAGLAASLAFAVARRAPEKEKSAVPLRLRFKPLVLLAATLVMFFLLPMELQTPYWWAVAVRLVPLAWIFAALALPASRRTPAWALAPSLAAGVFYGGYLAYDFRAWFQNVEMAGLNQVLDAIPKGARVHALYPPFDQERHYAHYPIAFAANYYVVRRGGVATPMMDGTKDVWVFPKPPPPRAPWGMGRAFSWALYGRHWDYFLVKHPPPGLPPIRPPLRDAPPGAVTLVAASGLWSVYKREP